MSFFGVSNPFTTPVGQKIDQATDPTLSSEDWALNMEICDLVNTTNDGPRDAIKAIRKKLNQNAGKNYTVVTYALIVLETCVKNCSKHFHLLACNKEFVSDLVKLIGPKNDPPTLVQDKVLSLIQCWADAFQHQPDCQGVVQVYQELKTKGVEFPMTDLDAMAPIHTPQRSVPVSNVAVASVAVDLSDGPGEGVEVYPGAGGSPQPRQPIDAAPATVSLSPSQSNKLRSDLSVVEGNMSIMADMLNEMTTAENHHPSDLELLNELADTLKAMQTRLAELVARLAGDDPLTGQLLHVNDELNGLLLRHGRFVRNRGLSGSSAAPSAVLGAALGVPGVLGAAGAAGPPVAEQDDALIDLSDDTPDIAKLKINKDKAARGDTDEFDMFAQSRNINYENTKSSGSSYLDNLEAGQTSAGLATATQARHTAGQPETSAEDAREFDEIAAWLNAEQAAAAAEKSTGAESVTSSDFDKFLASRAAAAETLPPAQHSTNKDKEN